MGRIFLTRKNRVFSVRSEPNPTREMLRSGGYASGGGIYGEPVACVPPVAATWSAATGRLRSTGSDGMICDAR
jgi:hypothetical protein